MGKTNYDSHKTVSATGRVGWTFVPILEDGTIDSTKPTIYCAGAQSQAEALAMTTGRGTFKQESTNERGTIVSYRYGSVVTLDVAVDKGKTRAEAAAEAFAALAGTTKSAIEGAASGRKK